MHRVNAVGNTLGVRRELAEGIGSLPEWRKGVHQKKTETHRKIIGGSRKACRDSLGDSPKGSRSSLGTRWEIVQKRSKESSQEYRRLPDWREVWSSPKEDRSWMPGCLKKEDSEVDIGRWR
ncbi:hypothetical protein B296_00054734 [Ensete ventricosum]|uniref:Uncharacterized protein n=1 Tax=Ensete ventricosum TaxID=4639 RepID=A0A426WWL3_ENSVE|nr:hypothetical protein B296_00054734 [Ensete ventricosum]